MSESPDLTPDPVSKSRDTEGSPTDPLLDSGSYIDPDRNDSGFGNESAAELPEHHPNGYPEFAPGVVIAAEPISVYVPGEELAEATPPPPLRRNPDEMLKRPNWLPEDWKIDLKVRSSGATAGQIDRYYVEPTGQRRFRSKVEVLHFLETGSSKPPKRKPTSEPDTEPSGSIASQKQRKSNTKGKKSETLNSNNRLPPHARNGVRTDN